MVYKLIQRLKYSIEFHINKITNIVILGAIIIFIISQLFEPLDFWLKKSNLWTILAIVFFTFILKLLVNINLKVKREYFNILQDQDSSNEDVSEFLKYYKPKKVDIFAYSSFTVGDIIKRLLEVKNCEIRLLIAEPSIFPKHEFDLHKDRQNSSLQSYQLKIQEIINDGDTPGALIIRRYNVNPSLRGINFDDTFLSVGWYLHTIRGDQQSKEEIRGHCNPLIHIRKTENDYLFKMFKKHFKDIWNNNNSSKPYKT